MRVIRPAIAVAAITLAACRTQPAPTPARSDTLLVARILLAEDRRDSNDAGDE